MKTITRPILSILFFCTLTAFQTGDLLCNAKSLKEKANVYLTPYKYDSAEMTKILYKSDVSVKEIAIPLFIGEKYRIVFELEALPKNVEVQIYNKKIGSKKRKMLFSSNEVGADKKEFYFEISKMQSVYIDYVIPPAEAGAFSGCAVLMVGYL